MGALVFWLILSSSSALAQPQSHRKLKWDGEPSVEQAQKKSCSEPRWLTPQRPRDKSEAIKWGCGTVALGLLAWITVRVQDKSGGPTDFH